MVAQILAPVVLFAAILGSGVAVFVWVFRDRAGAKPLAAFVVAASVVALAQGMMLATPTLADKIYWSNIAASVSTVLPLAWLGVVLAYVESDRAIRGQILAILLVEPVVFAALVWTNGDHGLVWTDRWIVLAESGGYLVRDQAIGMWAHTGYSYLLVVAGGFELLRTNLRTTDFFRSQGTALLGSIFVPVGVGALTMYGTVPPQYELRGLAFVFTGLVITATLFHGRLLSVTPATRQLGREAVIDEMDDPILILDDEDRIVDVNPAAAALLDVNSGTIVGTPLSSVAPELSDAIGPLDTGKTELELDSQDCCRFYDVRVSPLYRSCGGTAGRVVSFRDVTDRRQRRQRLDVLNRVLRHNLRNELNVVRGNAELLRREIDLSTGDARRRLDRIEETIDTVSTRSEKIGRVSRTIEDHDRETFDATARLEGLAESLESRYPDVTVRLRVPSELTVSGGPSLERAFEELLENAAEHGGESPTIRVVAYRRDGPFAEVRIADDGPGIERQERVVIEEGRETALEHGSGVGLWLVNWVVRECGGAVEFDDTDGGTTVVVTLPDVDANGRSPTDGSVSDAESERTHATDTSEHSDDTDSGASDAAGDVEDSSEMTADD